MELLFLYIYTNVALYQSLSISSVKYFLLKTVILDF